MNLGLNYDNNLVSSLLHGKSAFVISFYFINVLNTYWLQLEGRLKKKEPEEQKIKEEVDEKVQVGFLYIMFEFA